MSWNLGTTQVHVETTPIPLNKGKYDGKLDKDFVRLKFLRDPTSSTSDLCEFKMYFFDNGDTEDFLFFVSNPNMTLVASRTMEAVTKV